MSVLVIAVYFLSKNNCEMNMKMGGGWRRRREREKERENTKHLRETGHTSSKVHVDNFQRPNSFVWNIYYTTNHHTNYGYVCICLSCVVMVGLNHAGRAFMPTYFFKRVWVSGPLPYVNTAPDRC